MNDIKHWDGPGLDAWEPWKPQQIAAVLANMTLPWCVVGGWAIDLFLGRETRAHDDLKIGVPDTFFPAVRQHLSEFALHSVGDGEVRRLDRDQEPSGEKHQCWVLDHVVNKWRVDVMREPGDRDTWIFRRDPRIAAPRARMVAASDARIPYLRPEGVLLFKAKAHRTKDETDFSNSLPMMDAPARKWLRDALVLAHPGHVWLSRLG